MMKKLFLGAVGIFSLALLLSMGSPQTADAYEFYSDATNDVGQCGQCHTGFRDNRDYASAAEHNDGDTGICTKAGTACTVDADCPAEESCGLAWGDSLHNIHRAFSDLGNNCDFCHGGTNTSGSQVAIGSSGVAADGVNALGCSGCHVQAGLVLHHNANGITECVGCHGNVPSAQENVPPPWYGSITITPPGTLMDPCNFNLAEDFSKDPALLGLDNDGDNLYDTADPDCSPEICDDGIDNNGDGDIDCADSQCDGQTGPNGEICEFGTELTCNDTFDNDADTLTDCLDDNCDGVDNCEFGTELSCFDGFDNDADGLIDCADPDCDTVTGGLCDTGELGVCSDGTETCMGGIEMCVRNVDPVDEIPANNNCADTVDNDCDGLTDGNDPPCAAVETQCFDGIDNDGNGLTDCADPNCEGAVGAETLCGEGVCTATGNLVCQGGAEVDNCTPGPQDEPTDVTCDGLDGDCDGQIDEDYMIDDTCGIGFCGAPNNTPSSCVGGVETLCTQGPAGVEGPEGDLNCSDTVDNDCDGATDDADTDCGAQAAAPPVNQNLGFLDTALATSGLERAGCLNEAAGCHVEAGIEDRHHLLYNSTIELPSVIPYIDLTTNYPGTPIYYNCQGCHSDSNPPIVELECMNCHGTYNDGSPANSPHHGTAAALARNCKACHGDLVDNFDDGHYIPLYDPSLVTPTRSMGDGLPLNGYGNGAGACDYCHDSDTANGGPGTGTVILSNYDTHHETGLYDGGYCSWCHDFGLPFDEQIRVCEECHGPDSLHNIQTDSPNIANVGTIVIGGEDAGWGHVGRDQGPNDSDCWGCHGFAGIAGEAPGSGPLVPSVGGADVSTMSAGTAKVVNVTGAAFTNIDGATSYASDVALTAADGSSVTLTPSSISQDALAVTIPAATAPGNYDLQAVKAGSASNPTVISVTPTAVVTDFTCDGSAATINGSGFSGYQEGSGTSVTGTIVTGKGKNRTTTTETGAVSDWSDTQIVADFSACPKSVDVTTVFASDGGGDPPTGSCSDYGDEASCTADSACEWSVNKKGRGSCVEAGGGGGGGGGGKPPKNK